MMTKLVHIDFWKNNSDENYNSAIYNLNGKQYVFTLLEQKKQIDALRQCLLEKL